MYQNIGISYDVSSNASDSRETNEMIDKIRNESLSSSAS